MGRRPKMTTAQKKHAREQRALLTLRRAAVRYSMLSEVGDAHALALAFADVTVASDRYRETLTKREQRKLAGNIAATARESIEDALATIGGAK